MLLGSKGAFESEALDEGLVFVGFGIDEDLAGKDEEAVKRLVGDRWPEGSAQQRGRIASQVNMLCNRMAIGDLVVIVLKKNVGSVAIGTVTGEYCFDSSRHGVPHVRTVEWALPSLPVTSEWEPYLPYLIRPNTINPVRHPETASFVIRTVESGGETVEAESIQGEFEDGTNTPASVRGIADQQIVALIKSRFPDKKLERLVAGVLEAEGYTIGPTVDGPDQGVDVLAGHGILGFEPPLMCVQVKHESGPTRAPAVQQLKGAVDDFGAAQGLFVSWGGYTRDAEREARRSFFKIRLWYRDDLIQAVCRNYDRLPAELKAEIPLQRIWTVADEGDDD